MIRKEVEKLRGMILTPEELEEVILPLVATTKEGKKLWKVKYVKEELYGNEYNHAFVDKEKDIRKLTKIEAEEWFYQVQKELNVYHPKLFYKEDGEWIIYKEEKTK